MKKEFISHSQFFILVLLFEIGTSILFVPFLLVSTSKQDAWISILVGICVGFLFASIYGILGKRHPGLTIVEINENVLGKWGGKVLSFLFFIYFFILNAGLLRIIGDFITTHILVETPIHAIEILFMLIVIYGTRLGIETFSRTSEMVLPWILLFFILLVLFLLPEVELKNLLPIVENGIKPVMKGAFLSLGVPFADIIIFLMITPHISSDKQIGKLLMLGNLLGGMIIFIIVIMSILVLGPNQASQLNYPIFGLAQTVNIGNFIQRIEALAGGIVFISIFVKTTISFYALSLNFAQLLQLKEYKMLTFPFGIMVIVLANIMAPNIVFFQTFLLTAWTPIVLVFGLVFPLLLLGIDSTKNVLGKRKNKLLGSR